MPWFLDITNPMLWIVGGGAIILIVFIMIMFKLLIGKKY